jgi:hypothetical protein
VAITWQMSRYLKSVANSFLATQNQRTCERRPMSVLCLRLQRLAPLLANAAKILEFHRTSWATWPAYIEPISGAWNVANGT